MTDTAPGGPDRRPLRVVLTGPIGAGKSTVAALLAARGAVVVDADRVGHAVIGPGGEAAEAVARRWPSAVVGTPDGPKVDRSLLAAAVFADPGELATLEALTHPHIVARIEATVAALPPTTPVVVEMPLLDPPLEWPRLVIVAPMAQRRARAVARGMHPADVAMRMAAQPDEAAWRAVADWVIENDGDLDNLGAAVDRWWREFPAPVGGEGCQRHGAEGEHG